MTFLLIYNLCTFHPPPGRGSAPTPGTVTMSSVKLNMMSIVYSEITERVFLIAHYYSLSVYSSWSVLLTGHLVD